MSGTKISAMTNLSPLQAGDLIPIVRSGANGRVTGIAAATQSDQETASSTLVYVVPGVQQYHPSAAKAWGNCNSSGTLNAGYNVSSVTDSATGIAIFNLTTSFSSANYAAVATPLTSNSLFAAAGLATGAVTSRVFAETGAATDPTAHLFAAFGDQ